MGLYNYDGFDTIIKEIFEKLIIDFEMRLEKDKRSAGYCLIGSDFTLIFNYDRGDTFCDVALEEKSNTQRFNITSIYKYLLPEKKLINPADYDQDKLLQWYLMIVNNLLSFLTTNREWINDYLQFHDNIKKYQNFIMQNFGHDDPIYIKFIAEDPSWVDELKNLPNKESKIKNA